MTNGYRLFVTVFALAQAGNVYGAVEYATYIKTHQVYAPSIVADSSGSAYVTDCDGSGAYVTKIDPNGSSAEASELRA